MSHPRLKLGELITQICALWERDSVLQRRASGASLGISGLHPEWGLFSAALRHTGRGRDHITLRHFLLSFLGITLHNTDAIAARLVPSLEVFEKQAVLGNNEVKYGYLRGPRQRGLPGQGFPQALVSGSGRPGAQGTGKDTAGERHVTTAFSIHGDPRDSSSPMPRGETDTPS